MNSGLSCGHTARTASTTSRTCACGPRSRRRSRRRAGCSAATGTGAAGSRAPRGSRRPRSPAGSARTAASAKAWTTSCDLARRSARAARRSGRRRPPTAPRSASRRPRAATEPLPSHGRWVDALRPACASWMPGTAPWALRNAVIRSYACACSSVQMPASRGRDAPVGGDRGRLGDDQPGAAAGEAAEVDEVPVVGQPVGRGVLAHRRRPRRGSGRSCRAGSGARREGSCRCSTAVEPRHSGLRGVGATPRVAPHRPRAMRRQGGDRARTGDAGPGR